MENAGAGIASWILQKHNVLSKVVGILCGKGNNGGDGYVIARHLANAGARIELMVVGPPATRDARANASILRKMRSSMPGRISLKAFVPRSSGRPPDLLVDAIFGTGFSGVPRSTYASAIRWMNGCDVPRIAVDVPSGINGTTGVADGDAVRASATLTLGAMKTGLVCNDGRDCSGVVEVMEIGIPSPVFQARKHATFLVEPDDVKPMLPQRRSTAHKYSAGKVFVLAGSKGYTGAAALAAEAALRIGAGAVVLGTPDAIYDILAKKVTEVIVDPLPSTDQGTVSRSAEAEVLRRMDWADVFVVGPGLSRNAETAALVRSVVHQNRSLKMVIDADALSFFAGEHLGIVRKRGDFCVLSPHAGEFSTLSGVPAAEAERNRVASARSFARRMGVQLILKGAPTAIGFPDGRVVLNSTGNPGMATVGSGDVLSGVLGGLWAQQATTDEACVAGVYLHGLAGDIAARNVGQRSLVARDLINFLPQAVQRVEADS